jgi:AcrR family transcriptional regulator
MKNESPSESKAKVSKRDSIQRKTNELFRKKQERIIKKATKLFMKKGYAQSSMREISKVTGIDISNLYYFIKNKEEILFLAFDMLHSPAADLFEKHRIFDIEDPELQLRTAIRELARINYENKDEILFFYRESKALPKKSLKVILERESRLVGHFEAILKKLADSKNLNVEDCSFTANMIVYQSSFYPLRNWNMRKYSKEEVMDRMENAIMKAIVG